MTRMSRQNTLEYVSSHGRKSLGLSVLGTPPLGVMRYLHTHAIALLCTRVHDAHTCEIRSYHSGLHSRLVKCSFFKWFLLFRFYGVPISLSFPLYLSPSFIHFVYRFIFTPFVVNLK